MTQSSKFREALRGMGNPYATLDAEPQTAVSPALTADAVWRADFIRGENPCAWDYYFDALESPPPESPAVAVLPIPSASQGLSQAQFEQRARAIFRPYVPMEERGKLRDHHRDFITRNRTRSPQVRFRLINALSKYDLSSTPGLNPQFNREQDDLTRAKLGEIENSIEDAD